MTTKFASSFGVLTLTPPLAVAIGMATTMTPTPMEVTASMSAVQCQHEVERLHLFFQDWFTGRLEKSPEVEDQCTAHFADDFSRITPSGRW
jgi:hypothetical protein